MDQLELTLLCWDRVFLLRPEILSNVQKLLLSENEALPTAYFIIFYIILSFSGSAVPCMELQMQTRVSEC